MKLSPLLAQYLSTNKQLSLTGIGRFNLDDSGRIAFKQDITLKEDTELVSFIAERSGKMKSLVSADLDSSLELARQFLHIGKPYLFEGIGTLSKNKKATVVNKEEPAITQPDTVQKRKDSIPQVVKRFDSSTINTGMYRFVIEKAARQRAFYRYDVLKNKNFIDVKMDTKDSVLFNLYFLLPSSPADTARKRDSLQRLYGTRQKTTIEFN